MQGIATRQEPSELVLALCVGSGEPGDPDPEFGFLLRLFFEALALLLLFKSGEKADGHSLFTTHSPHLGRRAMQTVRPCAISRCE